MTAANRDIQRLVYPPKVWVFVKLVTGEVVDLTEYVIGGEVKRVINAASSATVRLRNPNHLFTTYGNKRAVLHPMDPITIYMQRFNSRHVQVFTGYLDTTPYLQLIPGVVQIEATCTLKKLMYNYFQLAQIYTLEFFKHFGWVFSGNGTLAPANQVAFTQADKETLKKEEDQHQKEYEEKHISIEEREAKNAASREAINQAAQAAKKAEEAQGKNQTTTAPFANPGGKPDVASDDGSFKKLLWAVLYYMADWKDENIYIEEMPPGIPDLVAKLWTLFNEGERQEELEDLKAYWAQIIGVGSKGSGGGAGNPANNSSEGSKTGVTQNTTETVEVMAGIAEKFNLPPAFVITTALCETGFDMKSVMSKNSAGATGWFQFTSSEPYPGIKVNYPSDAQDTGLATTDFCKAAVSMGHKLAGGNSLPSEGDWQHWAEETQKPGNGAYDPSWARCLSEAKAYLRNYKPTKKESEGSSTTQRGTTTGKETSKGSGSSKTRLAAMETRADEIDAKKYPYSWGGGHPEAGKPSMPEPGGPEPGKEGLGFDCAGSVAAVLSAGGFVLKNSPVPGSGDFRTLNIPGWSAGEDKGPNAVNVFFNGSHAWMTIKGRYFSTGWNNNSNGGAGWGSTDPTQQPTRGEYTVMHLSPKSLEQTYEGPEPPPLSGAGSVEELGPLNAAKAETPFGEATAADFLSQIQAPKGEEFTLAQAIGGQRALMNTTPVMTLVNQVCESSMRRFMSLPNGDFYAFYPDYFGEFGHHEPYWKIHNIEVIEGTIDLTDDNLITHYFATGDVNWPAEQKYVEEIYAGCMTIFEAFQPGVLIKNEKPPTTGDEKGGKTLGNTQEAAAFLKRYGARPAKHEFKMVYSALFDQLIAYQQFLLAWSRQFQSIFKFTFMPELFPGGKVAFPESGLKMYIEEVVHRWDVETAGFTTDALLTAPSVYKDGTNKKAVEELPNRMVEALIEPQRGLVGKPEKGPLKPPPAPPSAPLHTQQEDEEAFGPNFKEFDFAGTNLVK